MIRHATENDVDTLVNMSREFYPQTDYIKFAEFDETTVKILTENIIEHGIYLVGEQEGKIVGMLALILVPFMFNSNIISCHEVVWWVDPNARKSSIGIELIKRGDSIRKLRGAKSFQMMRLATSPEFLDEVFLNLGFKPSEFCFTKVD